ncbi:transposase [Streptomyces sp. S1D4-11]
MRTGRHVVHNLHVHLVFVTNYRRKAFTDAMLTHCEEVMREVCTNFEAELKQFNEDGAVRTVRHRLKPVRRARTARSGRTGRAGNRPAENGFVTDRQLWRPHAGLRSGVGRGTGGAGLRSPAAGGPMLKLPAVGSGPVQPPALP